MTCSVQELTAQAFRSQTCQFPKQSMQFFPRTCNESYGTSDWTLNTDSSLFQYVIIEKKRGGKRRKSAGKIEASHISLLTMACQTDPNPWLQWGKRHRQSSSAPGRVKLSVQQYVVLAARVSCFRVSVCFCLSWQSISDLSNMLALSLACLSACSFTAHGFLDSSLHYTPWNGTSLSCLFFLSLYCFF